MAGVDSAREPCASTCISVQALGRSQEELFVYASALYGV